MSDDNEKIELILASGSPRRHELLKNCGLDFKVISSDIDESTTLKDPAEIVSWLSLAKAKEVAAGLVVSPSNGRTLVLGADTIVVLDDLIMGKPHSKNEAFEMLMQLSGREHKVYTGVSIVELPGEKYRSIFQASTIFFRKIAESEAEYYASTDEPMDKAGAYALQGIAAAFVDRVDGCYSNVIGLPVSATVQLLREFGMKVLGT